MTIVAVVFVVYVVLLLVAWIGGVRGSDENFDHRYPGYKNWPK